MKNQKLIRIVEAFVIFPMAMSATSGELPKNNPTEMTTPQFVSTLKQNTGLSDLLALNQAIDVQTPEEKEAEQLQVARVAKAEAIDAYYRKYDMPLEGQGMFMVEQAELYNLDYRLIPAFSVVESTGGKFPCKKVTNSFLGYSSCRMNFKSAKHAIEVVARSIGGENPKLQVYAGKTTEQIIDIYNPDHIAPGYKKKVLKIMEAIGPADPIGPRRFSLS